jgi:hypothetical protein
MASAARPRETALKLAAALLEMLRVWVAAAFAALLERARASGVRLRGALGLAPVDMAPYGAALSALYEALEDLRLRINELEARNRVSTPPDRTLNLTLTSRGMVLKLSRQGQKPAQIARLLGIPQGEVLLLLKLQRRQGAERIAVIPQAEATA